MGRLRGLIGLSLFLLWECSAYIFAKAQVYDLHSKQPYFVDANGVTVTKWHFIEFSRRQFSDAPAPVQAHKTQREHESEVAKIVICAPPKRTVDP